MNRYFFYFIFKQNRNLSRPVIRSSLPRAPPAVMRSRVSSRIAWRIETWDGVRVVLGKFFQKSPDRVLVVSKNVVLFVRIFVQTKTRI